MCEFCSSRTSSLHNVLRSQIVELVKIDLLSLADYELLNNFTYIVHHTAQLSFVAATKLYSTTPNVIVLYLLSMQQAD